MRLLTQILLYLSAALTLGWAGATCAAADAGPPADIEVFVREGCPHCAAAEEFLALLHQQRPALRIIIHDVSRDLAAMDRLQGMARSHGHATARVPAFAVGGQLIIGYSDEASTGRLIRDSLDAQGQGQRGDEPGCGAAESFACGPEAAAPQPGAFTVEFLGRTLALDRVGLPLFTLALGLLDGFNPCSMWVLILMISLLAPLNNRPRMFAIAGTFVAVQGLAYFAFMAAWLNLFLLVGLSRISEIIIASLALLAGAINVKEFSRPGAGVSLSIPAAAKPGIYARMRSILQAENMGAALFATVVLGMLVQIVELMCTSGFPALFTRILTLRQPDSVGYYAYLLLYNFAYMLDDMVVLTIGIVTLSRHRLQEKEGRWLKLASGLAMLGLGIYLLLPR